ncbi:MAG TPA: hypothetical protein PKE47_13040, partial [Verrucomicrobiota bacterium]|nr:hypothetical protein [Verrucomicrobiota bacterium]
MKLTLDCSPEQAGPLSSSHSTETSAAPQSPEKTASTVSKSLPQVLIMTMPLEAGVKVYQTPLPKLPWHGGVGSPVVVAFN